MAADDIALRFHYPASTATNDMRTVLIKQVATVDGTETETDLYKVCFYCSFGGGIVVIALS